MAVQKDQQDLLKQEYTYDPVSKRLATIKSGGDLFVYSYRPGTDLVERIEWRAASNDALRMTRVYGYEAGIGRLESVTSTDRSGTAKDVNQVRFSSLYYDELGTRTNGNAAAVYYAANRYYSPNLMRWLTRDPMGEEGGVNLYAYCENDPVNRTDWVGLASRPNWTQDVTIPWAKVKANDPSVMNAAFLAQGYNEVQSRADYHFSRYKQIITGTIQGDAEAEYANYRGNLALRKQWSGLYQQLGGSSLPSYYNPGPAALWPTQMSEYTTIREYTTIPVTARSAPL